MTNLRVGTAFDAHQIQPGKECWIAGILHEGQDGCEGHSDGDVVSHAIVDAVLSASGLGDLGSFVGVGRPEYDGVKGVQLLQELKELLDAHGHSVVNVSAQLIGQTPEDVAGARGGGTGALGGPRRPGVGVCHDYGPHGVHRQRGGPRGHCDGVGGTKVPYFVTKVPYLRF